VPNVPPSDSQPPTKSQKKREPIFEMLPPPLKKISLSFGGPLAIYGYIIQFLLVSNNFLSLPKHMSKKVTCKSSNQNNKENMNGLDVKNGRLINNRPNGISGIQEAAMIKKAVKKMKKIEIIADGIKLSEMI
jgi:hypothetical protein